MIVENFLYDRTEPFDPVMEPMAGGSVTFTIGTKAIGILELILKGSMVLFDRLLPMDGLIIAYYFGEKAGQGAGKGYESRTKD
jgi:hypothetical protein